MNMSQQPARVLLIERSAFMRDVIAHYLVNAGSPLTIVPSDSFADAVETAESDKNIDIIVADIRSATTRGISDVNALRRVFGAVPILILAEGARPDEIIEAYRHGVAGLIPKTLPGRILILAIEIILCGERFIPSALLSIAGLDGEVTETAAEAAPTSELRLLSKREREVLQKLCEGHANAQIAEALGISKSTVRLHLHSIFRKLGVNSRLQAVQTATRLGFTLKLRD